MSDINQESIAKRVIAVKKLIASTAESIINKLKLTEFEPINELILTRTKYGDNSLQLEITSDRISSLSMSKGSLSERYSNFVDMVIVDALPPTELYKIAQCIADYYNENTFKTTIEKSSDSKYLVTLDWSELDAESKES